MSDIQRRLDWRVYQDPLVGVDGAGVDRAEGQRAQLGRLSRFKLELLTVACSGT